MAKGPKGPKGKGKGPGYPSEAEPEEFLERYCLGRRSLVPSGSYRLAAHPKKSADGPPPVCEGEYYFDVATGKLQAQDSSAEKMEIGSFSAEVVNLGPMERPGDLALPVVKVCASEVMREMQNPENANAFFVLPSQLNGAEFPSHCSIVASVEEYKYDHTGGPCAQLAAHPALAQFLLHNAATHSKPAGINAARQLVSSVNASLLNAGLTSKKHTFDVVNGYLKMPVPESDEAASSVLAALSVQLQAAQLRLLVASEVPVLGLTPSKTSFSQATHRVNLVYASAVPINAYVNGIGAVSKGFGDLQLQEFQRKVAELFLVAQYYGALKVAARMARKVFLMPLGGGAFKNSWESIVQSIALALEMLDAEDLQKLDIHALVLEGGTAGKSDTTPSDMRIAELLKKHRKLREAHPDS
ncbi:unnamed protein product [Effrenium voratum]|nr:unnamed protein product [Effrenium voratum]